MIEYFKMWKKTFNYKGIEKAKGYWIPFAINLGVYALLCLLLLINLTVFEAIVLIYFLASLLPMVSLAVRRLHDTDRSGYNMFWLFLPIAGLVILLVYLADKSKYNYKE